MKAHVRTIIFREILESFDNLSSKADHPFVITMVQSVLTINE